MFKSFLKKSKPNSDAVADKPDISRVIPAFKTESGAARIVPKAALVPSDTAETDDAAAAPADTTLVLEDADRVSQVSDEEQDAFPDAELADAEALDQALPVESWLKDDLTRLRAAAADVLDGDTSDEARRALFLVAHNMRGAAGAYGYPVIERITGSLCLLLDQETDIDGAMPLINLHVEACRAAIHHRESKGSADLADVVCTALEDQVSSRLTGWG